MNENPSPLFPEIHPFSINQLPVDNGHKLYVEQSGNPSGIPVIVLHGGPGTGCNEKSRRRFNPAIYRIICADQRGAGRSTPTGHLLANTTEDLIADIETIRNMLGITQWVLYGTSWGSTLALAYAQAYPEMVLGMVIGGIFLGTEDEINWLSRPTGLPRFRWREYQAVLASLPAGVLARNTFEGAIFEVVSGPDVALARRVAGAYALYEGSANVPEPDHNLIRAGISADANLVSHIGIELYYFANRFFLQPNEIFSRIRRIAHIPMYILQGELDMVCPPAMAHQLHALLPNSRLTLVPSSGHMANEAMEKARIEATNAMAARLQNPKPE